MDDDEHDIFAGAADVYDEVLAPAIFDVWAAEVTRRMGTPGGIALDIACGTGVLAAHMLDAGWTQIIGVDLSAPMLERAEDRTPEARWMAGDALDLPLDSDMADGLACSFALMFILDPIAALGEMARVTRAGAPVVVSTWLHLDECPGFAAIVEAVEAVGGPKRTHLLRAAFALGDADDLAEMADEVGLAVVDVSQYAIEAEFRSVDDLARTYSTSLGLDDADSAEVLQQELARTLAPWMRGDEVVFPMAGLILEARSS